MKYTSAVKFWLWIGVIMVFFQIVIGGITRLTGSGLSITKWEIVTGTLPPLSEKQWDEAFDLYKETPQYQKINEGMSMSEFKYIYFWEYLHRLWARLIFFVFLFPFIFFLVKKRLDKPLIRKLIGVVLLAMVVASIGWIMVASGLTDRPWVNAYKLSIHLILGLTLFSYLSWVAIDATGFKKLKFDSSTKPWYLFFGLLIVQIFLGGIMSGTRAALFYPTWPDMHNEMIPAIILQVENWNAENFINYDSNLFFTALVQFLHRSLAYILLIFGAYMVYKYYFVLEDKLWKNSITIFGSLLFLQVLVGIITVIMSWGTIPVLWGVLHQAVASLLLISVVFIFYLIYSSKSA